MPALTHKTKQKNVLHATGLFCIDELVDYKYIKELNHLVWHNLDRLDNWGLSKIIDFIKQYICLGTYVLRHIFNITVWVIQKFSKI